MRLKNSGRYSHVVVAYIDIQKSIIFRTDNDCYFLLAPIYKLYFDNSIRSNPNSSLFLVVLEFEFVWPY